MPDAFDNVFEAALAHKKRCADRKKIDNELTEAEEMLFRYTCIRGLNEKQHGFFVVGCNGMKFLVEFDRIGMIRPRIQIHECPEINCHSACGKYYEHTIHCEPMIKYTMPK